MTVVTGDLERPTQTQTTFLQQLPLSGGGDSTEITRVQLALLIQLQEIFLHFWFKFYPIEYLGEGQQPLGLQMHNPQVLQPSNKDLEDPQTFMTMPSP